MFFKKKEKKQEIHGYAGGRIIPVNQLNDKTFSLGKPGEGGAVYPNKNIIYAPCDGLIKANEEMTRDDVIMHLVKA